MTSNSPQTDSSGVKRRIRTRQACGSCRRRRRKCDGRHPCSQCIGYSYPCQYNNENVNDTHNYQNVDSVHDGGEHVYTTNQDRSTPSPLPNSQQISKPSKEREDQSRVPAYAHVDEQAMQPRPIVDTIKGRYSNAHSSILLPRRIGQSMNLADRVRFHSYGWNLNTRLEPVPRVSPAVCRYLTYQDLSVYTRVFFEVVDPMYHFLDQDKFLQECTKYWTTEREHPEDLEAVVAGVVALGSFFSPNANPLERELVEHAKQVLDVGCAYAPGRLSLSQTAGWVLRTLYLRLTTRPHLSWFASCCTLHVAEAMALHVDLRNVEITNKDSDLGASECISSRTGLFECAVFLNSIISAEYGRSRVTIQDATELTSHLESKLLSLSSILQGMDSNQLLENMHGFLLSLQGLPDEPTVFALMKADVAIHLFRKYLSSHQEKMRSKLQDMLLSILRVGFTEARRLLPSRHAWWNVVSTPFQSLMVLLALDSDESLAMVEEAMSVLDDVHNTFPTTLSEEVLQTAQLLIQGLEKRKSRQAKLLRKACHPNTQNQETFSVQGIDHISPDGLLTDQAGEVLQNWTNGNMNWSWISPGDVFYDQSSGVFDTLDSV